MKKYKNLEAQMIIKGVTRKDLADFLQVRYATISDKLRGKSSFTLDEAISIKRKFFPKCNLENLFYVDTESKTA